MISNADTNSTLIAGRAGELTLEANILTFDLLEHIFGQKGPYRETLKEFGVKLNDLSQSYLVLLDNKVFSDIEKEQKILWRYYPIKLVKVGHSVVAFSYFSPNPFKIFNYIQKSFADSQIILHSRDYVERCLKKYNKVSEETVKITQTGHISLTEFLSLYKDIVYVSYIYEVIEMYNRSQKKSPNVSKHMKETTEYIQQNDYLVNGKYNHVENVLKLPKGFYLDDYPNLKEILENSQGLDFIPGKIPLPDLSPEDSVFQRSLNAETILQCIKNNLRLKTNVLLFFLNLTLLDQAKKKDLLPISAKRFNQLL